MEKTILNELKRQNVDAWVINMTHAETQELFFIGKIEDTRRSARYAQASVTVYRDFEFEGKPMRGSSRIMVYPGTSKDELESKISEAYKNALNVKNPFFALPKPSIQERVAKEHAPLDQIAEETAKALYKSDTGSDSFINSSEIFVTLTTRHTLTSEGGDVSYDTLRINGEFVVQCKKPQDVEIYYDFDYSEPDAESLSKLSESALKRALDRASAVDSPHTGTYDVILCDKLVQELMSVYLEKTDASMVYPGYSEYKKGLKLNADDAHGEKLSINAFSSLPYSTDAIPMPKRNLIKDGEVVGIYGDTRFCRYLGIEPTGSYDCVEVLNGSVPFEEMKSGKALMPVVFSDFQCDSFQMSFGGEIRLAYLFENGKVSLLTGGSINGNLAKVQNDLVFSKERYVSAKYSGPKAVLIPGVSVAGK